MKLNCPRAQFRQTHDGDRRVVITLALNVFVCEVYMTLNKTYRLSKVGTGLLCLLPGLLVAKPLAALEPTVEPLSLDQNVQFSTPEEVEGETTVAETSTLAPVQAVDALAADQPFDSEPSSNRLLAEVSQEEVGNLDLETEPLQDASGLLPLVPVDHLTNERSDDATMASGLQIDLSNSLDQVTSVSQLSDVEPTDWAFQALQSLVERYGCIAGYPDGTFRGNRPMTRYEFAAGLNACLDRINELIATGLGGISPDDLTALQRMQEEFAAELASLRGRVDTLEARAAEIEANQFSTTTKLNGEVVFSLAGATGGSNGQDAQVVFNNRVRLNLTTSFTGRDLLITGLQSYSFGGGVDNPAGSIPGTLGLGDPVFGTASNVSLGTAPQFGNTNPDDLSTQGSNNVSLYKLLYIFPVVDRFTMFVASNVEVTDAFPAVAPFADDSQGAISRFATTDNAVIRVSGGTSDVGLASAVGFIWNIADGVDFRALYGSVNASIVNNNGLLGNPSTPLGAGLFNGSHVISSQLTLTPSDDLTIGLNYANSYHQINILGTGLSSSDIGAVVFNGGNDFLSVLDEGIHMNSIGATLNWQFAPKVDLTLSGSYIFADLVDVDASTNFISWLAALHFRDVFGEGNSAAIIFGQPLNRDSTGGLAFNPEDADPYHLEAYFNVQVNDHLSITPGVFAVFNPEGFNGNDTTVAGVLRTTFSF
jgi:hypothetical protein